MPIILSATANTATLQAPDAYLQIVNPPGYISGPPESIVCVVGTASWGPLHTPVLLGSPDDAIRTFAGVSSQAVSGGASGGADLHDLATELQLQFAQAQNTTLAIQAVRTSDGTDTAATVPLLASDASAGATATAKYTGVMGASIKMTFSPGSKTNTVTATVSGFSGGPEAETYPNLPSASNFWMTLQNAINQGMSGIRGPSQLVTLSGATSAVSPLSGSTPVSFSLSGGSDGRSSITTSHMLGSDTVTPKTGLYSLRNVTPSPTTGYLAGVVDNTAQTAQALAAFGDSEGIMMGYSFPTGTSTATALADKQTYSVDTFDLMLLKDHVYIWDPINQMQRLLPPYAAACGRIGTLPAHVSPLNKQVFSIIGTERTAPYSAAEIGQLNAAGITLIARPIPGGNVFGIRTAVNVSSNAVQAPIEYTRYTNKLAKAFAAFVGKYVGENQGEADPDPLREQVTLDFNDFLADEQVHGRCDSYLVQCDSKNNTPATIAKHFLYVAAKVKYMSSVWFFVVSLQGGTTVVTVGSSLGQMLAA